MPPLTYKSSILTPRVCKWCEARFTPLRGNQLYCGVLHRRKAEARRLAVRLQAERLAEMGRQCDR